MILVIIKLEILLVGGKQTYSFQDLPQFTPEIFMKVSAKNDHETEAFP